MAITVALPSASLAARFLFDAAHAQQAGNADWVVDATGSTVPVIPTPAQSGITASTPETFWNGGISAWGVAMAKLGHTISSNPTADFTNGTTGALDLSQYKVLVVCEPNNLFTATEKTSLINFVANGGGLFIVSDHTISDRDNDGNDSVDVWNDLFSNNGVQANPFGMSVNYDNLVQTSGNVDTASPIGTGVAGTGTSLAFHNGATFTLDTSANSSVRGAVWKTGTRTNSTVMMAYASYGLGRVVALGDSSPADDGTGASADNLYFGWDEASDGVLISNGSAWLASSAQSRWTQATAGNWSSAAGWTGSVADGAGFTAEFGSSTGGTSVTLDSARVVGNLVFTGTTTQTITGSSRLTLTPNCVPGVSTIKTSTSKAIIAAPLLISGSATIDVGSSATYVTIGNLLPSSAALTKTGAGLLNVNAVVANSLAISAGKVFLNSTTGSRLTTLSIADGASLDLGQSSLVLSGAANPTGRAAVLGWLTSGKLFTRETTLTIGYTTATVAGSLQDQSYAAGDILIMPTIAGDTTLDGTVNFDDLLSLAQHYGAAGEWDGGDFDRNGTVDFADLLALAQNYSGGAVVDGVSGNVAADWALARSLVPEPTSLALVTFLPAFYRRRR